MYTSKRGQNAPRGQIVKTKPNRRVIAIAIALALVGTITYVFAYQYTHSAKLEVELNQKESQLQEIQRLHNETINSSEDEQKQLEDKIKQLEADLQAKKEREAQSVAFATKQATASSNVAYTANCTELRDKLARLGVSGANLDAAITLATRESSCRSGAVNKSSGACGEFQSYPCGKWGAPGTDEYLRNAINYANSRYGSYVNALSHSYAKGWY